ncbi:pilus assembly protein [Rhodobacter sp. SGA-6-6]|uniref:TadE/TadG family type IV pilus assembly protein n=1 Tax=Rhodobacter sp. SGA-6-6 TaxID=2710882 RepID=UPI0013EA1E22|nr:TadE/TadG family type IV pilus assembly protein [Rhodobacter sp. SGA-6-6]NGM46419.1 pilus assembly protein [Rhodobacter sp. SGA-6-6]
MAPHILIFFFLMLLVGGIAVDLMRFENKRVAVQQTMDRATLAAASLENDLQPRQVVESYFATAGVESELDEVVVVQAMNSRTVKAKAKVHSDNYFMSMMNTPFLEADNRSQAEQRVTNVEISLVLDISGSMASNNRINNLKTAASEFIDTVLDQDTENKISISIVPYNGQVNLGPVLFSKFNVTNAHGNVDTREDSYCLDLPTSTYSSTALSRTTPLPQTPFVDSWSSTTQGTSYVAITGPTISGGLYSNMWCQPNEKTYVSVHRNNRTALKSQINNLIAVGATSIDLGLKWGAMLLDPGSRSIVSEMSAAGEVPGYFSTRPAAYGDKETLKVIVLMTDGENFEQERHGDNYRTGISDIWQTGSNGYMSIFHASKVDNKDATTLCNSRPFYVPHLNAWHSRPWNGSTPGSKDCYKPNPSPPYTNVQRLTWQAVWAQARTNWVAWQLYARALGGSSSSSRNAYFDTWVNNFRSYTDTGTMDARLDQVCEAAKAKGVLIYGIAFEAPAGGASAIKGCASSPASTYFFDANGLEIRTAFALIASNLSQLRLTQ